MRSAFLYITALLFLTCSLHAQDRHLDSLRNIYLDKSKHDTLRLSALNGIAFEYVETQPDTALFLSEQLKVFAEKSDNKKYLGLAYRNIAMAWEIKGDEDKGLQNYLTAIKIYSESGYKAGLTKTYLLVGHNYRTRYNYPKALEYYLKGLELAKEMKNSNYENVYYFAIGIVHLTQDNYYEALKYHLLALKLAQQGENKDQVANCHFIIAGDYQSLNKLDEALDYYSKALAYYIEIDYLQAEGSCYSGMGDIFMKRSEFDKALLAYKKGLETVKRADLKESVGEHYLDLADLYNKTGENKLALLYADSALQVSKKMGGDLANRAGIYETLSEAYAGNGKYEEAFESYRMYKLLSDSIEKESKGQTVNEVIARFESEKKEAEQEKQNVIAQEQKKRQQLFTVGIGIVLLVVMVFSVLLYRRFRVTAKQKAIIELKSKEIEEKNKDITDSIKYAKRIQTSLLPTEKFITRILKQEDERS